jgi:hypothetical protein
LCKLSQLGLGAEIIVVEEVQRGAVGHLETSDEGQ